MEIKNDINPIIGNKENINLADYGPQSQQSSNKNSYPLIAGILLIIAGILGIFNWSQVFLLDVTTLGSFFDISQIQEFYPQITYDQILGFLQTCAIIGIIISVFPILGGILSVQRKLYYIAITSSIIGLFSIGIVLSSSVLSLIGLVLLIFSKQQFK
jgi:predicted neutral ceramidase superfamily lipid hydrolase